MMKKYTLILTCLALMACGDDDTTVDASTDATTTPDRAIGNDVSVPDAVVRPDATVPDMMVDATVVTPIDLEPYNFAEYVSSGDMFNAKLCECLEPDNAECVAQNAVPARVRTCEETNFMGAADAELFARCDTAFQKALLACAGATCDTLGDCFTATDDGLPAECAGTTTESILAPYTMCVVGAAGTCPDGGESSTVGAMTFMGSTEDGGDDHSYSCDDMTDDFDPTPAADKSHLWTAPSTGMFTIDTLGSEIDTVLTVLNSCADTTEIACNDDVSGEVFQSTVTISATMGTSYLIVVDTFSTEGFGDYVVNITAL